MLDLKREVGQGEMGREQFKTALCVLKHRGVELERVRQQFDFDGKQYEWFDCDMKYEELYWIEMTDGYVHMAYFAEYDNDSFYIYTSPDFKDDSQEVLEWDKVKSVMLIPGMKVERDY